MDKKSSSQKNQPVTLSLAVEAGQGGQRLDKVLAALAVAAMPTISRARVQALMAEGHVSLAGAPVTTLSRKVKEGEVYALLIPPPEAAEPEAQDIALNVVHEDEDVIVIDKPVGLVVHPAPGNKDKTLVNALLAHCGASLSGIGGVARPGIVHRLDKDTSGLIVVAKNDHAHQQLTKQFADRSLSRTYQAVVWGVPIPWQGTVDAPIGRHVRDRKKMAVTAKGGKAAITHYRMVKELEHVAVVECKLATGRTHQIRVHMAHLKHPVVGDQTYGARKGGAADKDKAVALLRAFPRQALHAIKLEFIHPRTNRRVSFASPLPEDITKLLKALARLEK